MALNNADNPLMRDRSYGELPAELWTELQEVPPTTDGDLEYRPCCVQLKDGRWLDRVFVVPKVPYKSVWGIWPEEDSGKRHVPISEVVAIKHSPSRLPAAIANEIYRGGESCMGGVLFAI